MLGDRASTELLGGKRMEMLHLKYFVSVAECGSFSGAATLHHVAQPKISRYIRALEEEVGAPLFFRNGRGAELTEAGKFLRTHSSEILNHAAQIRSGIQSILSCPSGRVVLGLPTTVSSIVTLDLIDWTAQNYHQVELSVREAPSDYLLEMLAGGQIDIAVLADAPNGSTLMSQRVVDEQLYLVSRDPSYLDDAGSQASAGSTTVLVPGSTRSVAKLSEHPMLKDARLVPLDCLGAAVDMIRRGQGSVVLPSSYVRRMSEAQFVPGIFVEDLSISRSLSLTTSTQRPFTPAYKVISDQVVRMLKKAAAPKVDLQNLFAFGQGVEHTEAA